MKTTTWLACVALFATAAGCGAPEVRNSFEGPDRAGAELAVLFTPKKDAYSDRRPQWGHLASLSNRGLTPIS